MPGLFDTSEFDNLFNEIDKQTKDLDGKGLINKTAQQPRVVKPLQPRRTDLPDTLKMPLIHDRMVESGRGEPTWKAAEDCIGIRKFLDHLMAATKSFTHNYTLKAYIRLFNQQGHQFDPITAVALHRYRQHYSLVMWDFAANFIGLSREDAYLVMEASSTRIDPIHMKLRRNIFAALTVRPADIDWSDLG